jgi:hypothetical protein
MLKIGHSTVKKINEGKMKKGLYPNYPIRKKSVYETRADQIKDLLLNTKYTKQEIMKIANCSDETIRRINIGESFHNNNLKYPLRNL